MTSKAKSKTPLKSASRGANGNGKRGLSNYRTQRANANKHTPIGLRELRASVQRDGIIGAITVARDGETFDGSARLETLAEAMPDVRIVEVETDGATLIVNKRRDIATADDPRARRLGVAANVVAKLDYNPDGELLAALAAEDEAIASMVKAERDSLRAVEAFAAQDSRDAEPQIDRAEELRVKWGVELGQLWQLGEHRLICGDCTDAAVVERVMGGERADMVFADPPYNVKYSGRGQRTSVEIENDDMPEDEFKVWLNLVCKSLESIMDDGCPVYMCHGDTGRRSVPFIECFDSVGWVRSATIIWAKQVASMGWQDYRSQHECISYGWKSGRAHYFVDSRSQTTLWEISRDSQNSYIHPTTKPVELPSRAIENSSRTNEVVVDFFLGSGTTLIACENLSRKCRAVEISPAYVAVALQRYQDAFGKTPTLIG